MNQPPQPGQHPQHPGQHPQHPGQPMYAAYPPQGGAPQPPAKKPITKRWWFWVLLALVGLGMLSQCGGGGSTSSTGPVTTSSTGSSNAPATQGTEAPPATQAAPKKTEEQMAGLNTPVKDSDVEFTVTDYACGVTVKDAIQTLEPQGKFCRMKITAKNVSNKQVTLSDSNIRLVDAGGAEYKSSSETWMVEGSMFLKAINPGNTLNGVVVIDVPKDVNPVTAVLSGGYFSKGAKVKVG